MATCPRTCSAFLLVDMIVVAGTAGPGGLRGAAFVLDVGSGFGLFGFGLMGFDSCRLWLGGTTVSRLQLFVPDLF
jgi:hypothetical protein